MEQVSICVPVYEMRGRGVEMLQKLLASAMSQTYGSFEVVVSDHSREGALEALCKKYPTIRYIRNETKRGSSSANLNNAIKHATGTLIKPVFQDDHFTDSGSLERQVKILEEKGSGWCVCGCKVISEIRHNRGHTPAWSDEKKIAVGENTLGPPSCLLYRRAKDLSFNDGLIWLMDCDFYYQLYKMYGAPSLSDEKNMTVIDWEGNVTHTLATKELRALEEDYMKKKLG